MSGVEGTAGYVEGMYRSARRVGGGRGIRECRGPGMGTKWEDGQEIGVWGGIRGWAGGGGMGREACSAFSIEAKKHLC